MDSIHLALTRLTVYGTGHCYCLHSFLFWEEDRHLYLELNFIDSVTGLSKISFL